MSRRESDLRASAAPRKESIGRLNPRQVSLSDPSPTQNQMVTVAVLAPRLPSGPAAPRTGVPMADVFNWDETVNWSPSPADLARQKQRRDSKNPFKRALTTQREKANPDLPPFVMRQVPYEVWRKHYAKDKEGNYKGTHAPAEDCLLRPHDVDKWKFKGEGGEGADAYAGKFTRGKEALPVYHEVKDEGMVPGYEADYDPNQHNAESKESTEDAWVDYDRPPPGEPLLEDDEKARREERQQQQQAPPPPPPPTPMEPSQAIDPNSGLPYDAQRERRIL